MAKRKTNPFKPTAGAEPPVLAGRDKVIEDFIDGLEEGPGAPGRLMRITGPRGSGKTVMLTELGDIARDRGWLVLDETAKKGFLPRLTSALLRGDAPANLSADLDLGIAKVHAGIAQTHDEPTFREALSFAASRIGRKGVLITVDEVQDADKDEMAEIATAVQHAIREGKNVAFVFAGITTGVLDFINGSTLTFLRRAKPEELASIPIGDVEDALAETFEITGMKLSGAELKAAAEATHGYAFLIQLVGYEVWRACRRHLDASASVTSDDVASGTSEAIEQYANIVLATALNGISERAMRYLVEMAKRPGPIATRSIAEGLNISASSLSTARKTLISRQIIEPTARGYVDFSIPMMREYISENVEGLMSRFSA